MKKMAARDFEDILQCLLPVCEGLFGEFDALVQLLVFRLQIWHAYAKLRLHTSTTIERFRKATSELCETVRKFARDTAKVETHELPREQNARIRRNAAKAARRAEAGDAGDDEAVDEDQTIPRRAKPLNLETYKYQASTLSTNSSPSYASFSSTRVSSGPCWFMRSITRRRPNASKIPISHALHPPLIDGDESKSNRGSNHPVCRAYLLPPCERAKFPELTFSAADTSATYSYVPGFSRQ
ncbi:hypothetical protein MIND_01120800 [Mycena indigotica]|uniref:Uncharacterized protein n=1 Tax=Mycena indigotica TaxID=2126181 RepID=A0A8H6S5V2_9AGAR|nr:uncharacterized protein MIND_01120800 [Mycena indigotica]KAF7293434.1 hypothetical protein MIND_01120800 [Mycena indigotica]